MTGFLILVAVVIFTCVLLNNFSTKFGIPVLLAFIVLGMVFGNIKFLLLDFNDFNYANEICSAALLFIMFYGGFGTRWQSAKSIATEAGILASLGVILTAALTGLFVHFVLHWGWVESFLMGSVVSSTDAASVFSILRSRKLNLKKGTAPILEVESGSNDPCSNMLTLIMISFLQGTSSGAGGTLWMIFAQIVFGAGLGLLIAQGAIYLIRHINISESSFDSMFILAVAIFSYAFPAVLGGNGYLSAYIVGIILGNVQYKGRKSLVNFFDGFTGLMQVLIFFMLGLLARPSNLLESLVPAIIIFAAMTLVVRPLTVCSILTPFGKYPFNQQSFISFVGLRGASSIVFAIVATVGCTTLEHDIFSTVFCIVLMSIALQGSLIPWAARKFNMIDAQCDVMKTFSDCSDEEEIQFSEIAITSDSNWNGKRVMDLHAPKNILFCQVYHKDGTHEIPDGNTLLTEGDSIIMCTKEFRSQRQLRLIEHPLSANSRWAGRQVKEYPKGKNEQLVLIRRGDESIIPNGSTILKHGDILIINKGF